MNVFDIIIIGGGIYGLHAAFNKKFINKSVVIIEKENEILKGASFSNQARLHNGYHYPRSFDTAKSANYYFNKCYNDYKFAMNDTFKSIYAIAKNDSLTSAYQFENFCSKVNIEYEEIDANEYFKDGMVEKAYITKEYTFDADLIREYYIKKLQESKNINVKYNSYITDIETDGCYYIITLNNGEKCKTRNVICTVYRNVNYLNKLFNQELIDIKYELCEVELINVNEKLKDVAITVMDGPFFSIMPFGKKNIHTLTSVNFTPHESSFSKLPNFSCQKINKDCKNNFIYNCNDCPYKPKANIDKFYELYHTFIKDDLDFNYKESLFAVKPILVSSEFDDSRPTLIKKYSSNPTFINCFSGKFSTVYLLDEFIDKNF